MLFDSRTVYLGASRDKYEQYCSLRFRENQIQNKES